MTRHEPGVTFEYSPERISTYLSVLVGQPLTDMWRPCSQCFEFGEQRPYTTPKGHETTRAQVSLFVYANWRIAQNGVVVMGSDDHRPSRRGSKRRFYDRKTPPRDPERRRAWTIANAFLSNLKTSRFVVLSVEVGAAGLLHLTLTKGVTIDVVPCGIDSDVCWWYLADRSPSAECWVGPDLRVYKGI
ncbi:MAG: hypothetical protein JST30_13770 [Armatimonadetes bacterium]|nr:hypothetical protein [Armatimonadota bacterium]